MHAEASRRRSGSSSLQTPDRGIERRDSIRTLNDEREGAAGRLVAVLHRLAGGALDPFLKPAPLYTLQTREGVPPERGPPMAGYPHVGPKYPRVNADDRIALGRDIEPPQGRPEQCARRDEA